jgi:hypothetical protein
MDTGSRNCRKERLLLFHHRRTMFHNYYCRRFHLITDTHSTREDQAQEWSLTTLVSVLLGVDVRLERLHLLPRQRPVVVLNRPVHVVRRRPPRTPACRRCKVINQQTPGVTTNKEWLGKREKETTRHHHQRRGRWGTYLPRGGEGDLPRGNVPSQQPHPRAACLCAMFLFLFFERENVPSVVLRACGHSVGSQSLFLFSFSVDSRYKCNRLGDLYVCKERYKFRD